MTADSTDVHDALRAALALHRDGDLPGAEQAYRQLLARFGSQPDAEHMLGVTLHALGRSAAALPLFERASQARVGVLLWNNHAAALLALGRGRDAAALSRRAIETAPENAGAWFNLGLALEIDSEFREAIPALEKAVSLKRENTAAHRALLRCQLALADGESDRALELCERILALDPNDRQATVASAQLRIARGETDAGLDRLRRWLTAHADDKAVAGTYFVACNYSEAMTPSAMLSEHRQFPIACELGKFATATDFLALARWLDQGRIQRGSLRDFSPRNHEGDAAHRAGYRTRPVRGRWRSTRTRRMGRRTTRRQPTRRRASDRSHRERSHRHPHRFDGPHDRKRGCLFAARAAPIQIAWLDAFYTTGIGAMDYLITDPWLSPSGTDNDFTEKLIRLPHGRLAYNPPPAPAPTIDAPNRQRFVSLNRFAKVNAHVIDVWAKILERLPTWTLLLKARGRDDDLAAHFKSAFERAGIDPDRIEIEGEATYAEAMATYDRAAIALDPFPFSGCSTTCDALWMGVPVVTWPRETMASRQTAAWLAMAGRSEWVAHDARSYIDIAVDLANDEATRRRWRANAREILRPTVCDSERLARELVEALRTVANR